MKFKSFRNIVVGGATATGLAGGGAWYALKDDSTVEPDPIVRPADPPERPSVGGAGKQAPIIVDTGAAYEAFLQKKLGAPGPDKVKDAMGARGPKVNLYGEGGVAVRAKVDLDRDDKWDEKWSFKDGVMEVKRSSRDDENYDQTRTLGGAPSPVEPLVAPVASGDPVKALLVAKLGQPGSAKIKDALGPGKPKVNIYPEDGKFARAKVDLDRDERWDEKWAWKNGNLSRSISTRDDDSYDRELQLDGEGNPVAAPAPAASTPGGLRPVDQVILAERGKMMSSKKRKDITKGQAYKVNVYATGSTMGRAKVDLDRDDKWDEKWTIKGQSVERQVAPNDDENYTEVWTLSGSGWKKK